MADNGPQFLPSERPPDDRLTTPPGVQTTAGGGLAPLPLGPAPQIGAAPGARTALVLLLLINMFNYIDRQVLAAVEPKVEGAFFPGNLKQYDAVWMGVTWNVEFWMGLLSTAFMVAYMLLAPVFGVLADRMSRWKLIAFGVAVWSLASGASGLAGTFVIMLLTRAVVGVGEAAYGPAAPALISDMYPEKRRGYILSWFYVAIPVGSALGYVLGGQIIKWTGDWRWAFYVVVAPGLALAVWSLFMPEPARGGADAAVAKHHASLRDYGVILRTPSFLLCTLGYTAATFVVGGVGYWMPRYIARFLYPNPHPENPEIAPDVLGEVNLYFGIILVVSGLLATLAGGWAGDWLRGRVRGSYFLVSGVGMLIAAPLVLGVLWAPLPWTWVFVFLIVFWLFFNTGPINTIPANVTHPAVRASAYALLILVIHLFGDAFSPPIIGLIAGQAHAAAGSLPAGWASDFFAHREGWDFSFCLVSALILLAAALWLWGTRYLDRDTALALTRGPAGAGPAE
jgi:MFS family permease